MTDKAKYPLIPSPNALPNKAALKKAGPNKNIPKKIRHDGWTPARRKTFLATLRQTGCIRDACRVIAMSSTSAYRLRRSDATFRAAWDDALSDARRGLLAVAHERAVIGRETIIIRNGVEVERRITPDSSILALLIKEGNRGGRVGNRTADKVITTEEWRAGIRFDGDGQKADLADMMRQGSDALNAKLDAMREKILARGDRRINLKTGDGIDADVIAAVQRFSGGN